MPSAGVASTGLRAAASAGAPSCIATWVSSSRKNGLPPLRANSACARVSERRPLAQIAPLSGRALDAAGADRVARWSAEDVARRMDFGLRSANAHGTGRELFGLFRAHASTAESGASPLFN